MPPGLLLATAPAGNWNVPTDAKNLKNPTSISARTVDRGREIFGRHCVECHGADAAGKGTKSNVDYDLRSIVDPLTDGELYWKITHGVGKMPSYAGVLRDEERWLLVNYLRHLRKLAAAPTQPHSTQSR